MTKRLYFDDPYTLEFQGEILERRETERGAALVLRETYFYPESGGQPHDLGTIDGIAVTEVLEEADETVLHVVERFPDSDRVACRIDAARRRDHMQQHSGQHVLSAAFVHETGAHTTSFHLGATVSTIDLDKALTDGDVRRVEEAANATVRRGLPIRSRFVAADAAAELDLRKPPPEAERLRIVEVEGFDQQACCGTHPRSSAEIGPIVVRGTERLKDGTRVEFLCGHRVFRDYHDTTGRIRALSSVLSSSEADLVETAERFMAERKSMGKELARVKGELLLAHAEEWMGEAEPLPEDRLLLVKRLEEAEPSELRAAAVELTSRPGRVVLLGSVASGRAHLVFAASEDVKADMGRLLKDVVDLVDGKGGGSARVAQGGGARTEGLAEALESAATQLR